LSYNFEKISVDSQTSERSGTNKLVTFPNESEQPKVVSGVCVANSQAERFHRSAEIARKHTPTPWGGIEPPKRFWIQGLPWGMIPFINGAAGG